MTHGCTWKKNKVVTFHIIEESYLWLYHIWDRTLSMQEGDWRVFAGAVKYFRHVLKSNEIFLKIFNGPQDIFLFSFIVLIFSSFI